MEEVGQPLFTKSFEVSDEKGNKANVTVSGTDEGRINEFTPSQFEIFVTYITPGSITSSKPTQDGSRAKFQNRTAANTINISVTGFSLQDNVTGFRVDLKPEFKNSTQRWDYTNLQYDASGVVGAFAHYLTESCSGEELDIDLDKKQACSNLFWQDLSSAYFTTPGSLSEWSFVTSAHYCVWRFRYEFEDNCNGRNGTLEWWWWL